MLMELSDTDLLVGCVGFFCLRHKCHKSVVHQGEMLYVEVKS